MKLTTTEKLRLIMYRQDVRLNELAYETNQTPQNLCNKLSRGNLTEKSIVQLAAALGCTVDIVFTLPDGSEV